MGVLKEKSKHYPLLRLMFISDFTTDQKSPLAQSSILVSIILCSIQSRALRMTVIGIFELNSHGG